MRSLLIGMGALGAMVLAAASISQSASYAYLFTKAPSYSPEAWLHGADRFPNGAEVWLVADAAPRLLAAGLFASADAALSYDATRVLIAGKANSSSRWQIYEIALGHGTPRQVTHCDGDCVRPAYLPDGGIVYTNFQAGHSEIETAGLDGGNRLRLTYAPGRYLTSEVLYDGRILFESQRQYGASPVRELMTVFPDGTGVESLRCDHYGDRHSARQLSSRDVLFVQNGRPGRISPAFAGQTMLPYRGGELGGAVSEISPGVLLAARRDKPGQRLAIVEWNGSQERVLQKFPAAEALDPVAVAPRPVPRRFPSALVPTRTAGNLLCLNTRITRDAPIGAGKQQVRVFSRDAAGKPVLLGQAPIESDGSFYVQVPADRPLRMELVDERGQVIRAEKNWFWMRPSEQRICVGCHAGPERAPDNVVPEILTKTTVPLPLHGVGKEAR